MSRPGTPAIVPLAPLTLALVVGVVLDRHGEPGGTALWSGLALALFGLAAGAAWRRWPRASAWATVAAFVPLGGAYHHWCWFDLPGDDLAHGTPKTPQPEWLRGVLIAVPEFRPSEWPDESGMTHSVLSVTAIYAAPDWRPASGRVRLTITGDRTDLKMGEPVLAVGTLAGIEGPTNPGQIDPRLAPRAEGIRLRMSVGEPEGIEPDRRGRSWFWTAWLGRARASSHRLLVTGLDPAVAPLAAALLLGRREAIAPEVSDAFARTGTMHLLAISGLHLQVLALALWTLGRLARLPRKLTFALVALATVLYALLVGLMPSVVRSAAMTVSVCVAGWIDRPRTLANLLATAAIATLLVNPANLFDVGCQLSFLAVAALFWAVTPVLDWLARPLGPLDQLERRLGPPWRRWLWSGPTTLWVGVVSSAVVWVVTSPLIALRFHLLSPIGILLNVPLIPITSAALLLAGLCLTLAGLGSVLLSPVAGLCGFLLALTDRIVRWGMAQSWGHTFTIGPTWLWVLGLYTLMGFVAGLAGHRRGRQAACLALGLWVSAPLLEGVSQGGDPAPEVEVLDVGHGLAVRIATGSGRAVLYDCGRLRDPHVGRRLIAPALWARGVARIDRVILSHADADHFNGLPDLLDRFAVGGVTVPPGFAAPGNPAAVQLLADLRDRHVPIRTVAAGESLDLGLLWKAEVRHPATGWMPEAPDNARSLVLDLAAGGSHLLLTGDLDGPGLTRLTDDPPGPIAAWLAPHHGGRTANPPWLYEWAKPPLVLVSQRPPQIGSSETLPFLAARGFSALRTSQQGALRVLWGGSGLTAMGFLDPQPEHGGERDQTTVSAKGPEGSLGPRALIAFVGFVVGLLACGALAGLVWGAWALVRPGGRTGEREPSPWEAMSAVAADGTRLAGAWRAAEGAGGRTILLLHGFGEDRTSLLGRAEALHARGWNMALLDSRGRGGSDGDWITFGALEAGDVSVWLDVLADRVGQGFQPTAWGRSMGAAVALRAAAEDARLRALILEAPYAELRASVAAWLSRSGTLPGLFAGPMLRLAGWIAGADLEQTRPLALAAQLDVPVLIVHGIEDRIAPVAEVRRLAVQFTALPVVIGVPGAGHADVFEVGGLPIVDQLSAFLEIALVAHGDSIEASPEDATPGGDR